MVFDKRTPLLDAALSRRSVVRALTMGSAAASLAGCTGMAALGPAYDASALSADPILLAATNRKPSPQRQAPWFGPERSSSVSYVKVRLVPPDTGRFSLVSTGLADWAIQGVEPVARFDDLLGGGDPSRETLIYVHGFNQTFDTTMLDAARLSEGVKFRGETLAFSWPSRAKLLDYGYDRESAMWSRDALEQFLDNVLATTTGRVHIVAHSVGTMLTMEALRQLASKQGETATRRFGSIILASPDIDMDSFSSSVRRIGDLVTKLTVITSTNDRALGVSSWIAGGMARVGAAEKVQLEKQGVRVIDASQQGWGFLNHDLFLSNENVRRVIRAAIDGAPIAPASLAASTDAG